ncbi:MmoB/DmpM family protein [Sulfurimonas sp.]|uniref:MmoB/DmpM family protein n=1 Tax=Sulfurimonas sp. TaxID=2022749 RepID=UPI002B46029C|nr:MmoB/DmpM family protein [Sulfurimonas sp.]
MSIALLIMQDTEDGRAIVRSIQKDNSDVKVTNKPAMIQIEREKEIVVKASTVSEELGREWDVEELQIELVSLGGQINETDDEITVYWDN